MTRHGKHICSPWKRVGGKAHLKSWIIHHLPAHDTFVECMAASAPVLLGKKRAKTMEIYNDLDRLWYNSARVARDHGEELALRIEATPYSREEFDQARKVLKTVESRNLDAIELARLHLVVVRQSFGSTGSTWSRSRPGGQDQAQLWSKLPQAILQAFERLRGVHIECRDYRELLLYYDGDRTTFYLDPPYEGVEDKYYDVNRSSGFDHEALREAVEHLKGSIVISYYEGDIEKLYDGWRRVERPVKIHVGVVKTVKKELLFIRPSAYAAGCMGGGRDMFPDW